MHFARFSSGESKIPKIPCHRAKNRIATYTPEAERMEEFIRIHTHTQMIRELTRNHTRKDPTKPEFNGIRNATSTQSQTTHQSCPQCLERTRETLSPGTLVYRTFSVYKSFHHHQLLNTPISHSPAPTNSSSPSCSAHPSAASTLSSPSSSSPGCRIPLLCVSGGSEREMR